MRLNMSGILNSEHLRRHIVSLPTERLKPLSSDAAVISVGKSQCMRMERQRSSHSQGCAAIWPHGIASGRRTRRRLKEVQESGAS